MRAVKHEWASSWRPALRRGAGHSRLTAGHRGRTCTTEPRAIQSASIRGRKGPPPVPFLCGRARRGVTVLRPERGGRSSGCLSGTLRRPPSSESHRRRPPLFPPRCHALYPVVPVTNLRAGARLHPRSVRPHRQDSLRIRSLSRPPRLAAGARVWRWGLRSDALGAGGSPRRPSRPFRPGTWITSGLRPRSDPSANFLASV